MKLTLYTQPNCPRCPATKALVSEVCREKGMEVEEVDISTDEGMFDAVSHNVMSTPSIVAKSRSEFKEQQTGDCHHPFLPDC